jgi:hypothetical protein
MAALHPLACGEYGRASPLALEDRPMTLMLTDAQLDHLHRLASPIEPARRSEFLQAVNDALELETGGIGEGVVHRIAARLQRSFWEPPALSSEATAPRHLVRASA